MIRTTLEALRLQTLLIDNSLFEVVEGTDKIFHLTVDIIFLFRLAFLGEGFDLQPLFALNAPFPRFPLSAHILLSFLILVLLI